MIHTKILILGLSLVIASGAAHADVAKGKALYDQLCTSCHGAAGKGDGPVGAALPADQKPRNLTDHASYKFAKDDAKYNELLKKGGQAVGLSILMPPQPQLSDADIASVIEYTKSLK